MGRNKLKERAKTQLKRLAQRITKLDLIEEEWQVYGEHTMRYLIEEIKKGGYDEQMALRDFTALYKGTHTPPTLEALKAYITQRVKRNAESAEADIQMNLISGDDAGILVVDGSSSEIHDWARIRQLSRQIKEISDINRTYGDSKYYAVVNDTHDKITKIKAEVLENQLRALKVEKESTSILNQIRASAQVSMGAVISGITREFKKKFGEAAFDSFSKILNKVLDDLDLRELEQEANQRIKDFKSGHRVVNVVEAE